MKGFRKPIYVSFYNKKIEMDRSKFMNEKMDKLQDIFETANLIYIKELLNQLHYSNSDVSEAAKEELPCGLKFEVQRVAKGQEILLDLITKLIDELDADFIHGMELLKELEI